MRYGIYTEHTTLIFSPFGNSYVGEQRDDGTRGLLAPIEDRDSALIDFGAMLASLRAALCLR